MFGGLALFVALQSNLAVGCRPTRPTSRTRSANTAPAPPEHQVSCEPSCRLKRPAPRDDQPLAVSYSRAPRWRPRKLGGAQRSVRRGQKVLVHHRRTTPDDPLRPLVRPGALNLSRDWKRPLPYSEPRPSATHHASRSARLIFHSPRSRSAPPSESPCFRHGHRIGRFFYGAIDKFSSVRSIVSMPQNHGFCSSKQSRLPGYRLDEPPPRGFTLMELLVVI